MCHLEFHYSASESGQAHKLCMHVHAWRTVPRLDFLRFLEAINLHLIVTPIGKLIKNLDVCMHVWLHFALAGWPYCVKT